MLHSSPRHIDRSLVNTVPHWKEEEARGNATQAASSHCETTIIRVCPRLKDNIVFLHSEVRGAHTWRLGPQTTTQRTLQSRQPASCSLATIPSACTVPAIPALPECNNQATIKQTTELVLNTCCLKQKGGSNEQRHTESRQLQSDPCQPSTPHLCLLNKFLPKDVRIDGTSPS